jgi:hypothetical protein
MLEAILSFSLIVYPLIELPRPLTAALASFPFPLQTPAPVPLPTLPPPARMSWGNALRLSGWVVSALLVVVLGWLILGALLVIVAAGDWWGIRRRVARRQQQDFAAYEEAFTHYLAYPALLAAHEQAKAAAATPAAINRYRATRVADVLRRTASFQRIPAGDFQPPQGRSEASFGHYLRQNFGGEHIFTACRVRAGSAWYYPDLIYSDSTGLRVDIEIDEPYVWATGKPHHCIGQDDARNAFFLQQQWLVLRFTEEQVARYPMSCCQLLADLIFQVTGQHYAPRSYHERLAPQPQWDWAEAKRLAAVHSRKSYEANLVFYKEEEL